MNKFKAVNLGPLPVQTINKTINTYLDEGDLWVSKAAHKHIYEKHPDDYGIIFNALADIVKAPQYIGIDTHHRDNFNIVCRIAIEEPKGVLIAIGLERNEFGNYNLRSAYRIKQKDIDSRRQKRLLHIAKT